MHRLLYDIYKFVVRSGAGIFSSISSSFEARNKKEEVDIKRLEEVCKRQERIIALQSKIINVTETAKPIDFDGVIKRMHDDKL